MASPFTDQISAILLPEKFKVPSITTFTGNEDPTEHLDNYRAHLDLHETVTEVACRAFPFILFGSARDWFRKLSAKSIDSFDDLGRKFLVQFLVGRVRKKPSGHLMPLCQQDDESLKDHIMRFSQAKLFGESLTNKMVYASLYQGLRPEGPLMAELARLQPENLLEFMEKVEEFINQEETLQAMIGSRQT
jgi:hypothetical protein